MTVEVEEECKVETAEQRFDKVLENAVKMTFPEVYLLEQILYELMKLTEKLDQGITVVTSQDLK